MGKTHYLGPEESGLANLVFSKNQGKKMVVFDIGVNRGLYIDLVKDRINTTVHGFEPIEHLFSSLTEKYLDYKNVILNQTPVSDTVKKTFFCEILDDIMDGCSSLVERPVFAQRYLKYNKYEVTTTSVDIYCSEKNIDYIDLMKIDVEGAELQVLKGCEKMLESGKIEVIQFEYGDTFADGGSSLQELCDYTSQFGYYVNRFLGDRFEVITEPEIHGISLINNINLILKKND
jgi:FkbM family methyltransferase